MIREKIWYEIADAKHGDVYLALYLNRCRNRKRLFKIITLVFSAGGVFGWSIWEPFAVIACVLIAIIQLLALIENQIVRSDDDILKICELRNLYIKYLDKLEKLWVDLESNKIDDSEASENFFALRETMKQEIESKDNELEINGEIRNLLDKAHVAHVTYLTNRYGKGN